MACSLWLGGCLYLPAPWSPDVNVAPEIELPDLSRCDERVARERWACDLVLDADPVGLWVMVHDPDAAEDVDGDTADPDACDVCFFWAPEDVVRDVRPPSPHPGGRYSSAVSVAALPGLHNRRLFLDVTDGPNSLQIEWRLCHPGVDPSGCAEVKR